MIKTSPMHTVIRYKAMKVIHTDPNPFTEDEKWLDVKRVEHHILSCYNGMPWYVNKWEKDNLFINNGTHLSGGFYCFKTVEQAAQTRFPLGALTPTHIMEVQVSGEYYRCPGMGRYPNGETINEGKEIWTFMAIFNPDPVATCMPLTYLRHMDFSQGFSTVRPPQPLSYHYQKNPIKKVGARAAGPHRGTYVTFFFSPTAFGCKKSHHANLEVRTWDFSPSYLWRSWRLPTPGLATAFGRQSVMPGTHPPHQTGATAPI